MNQSITNVFSVIAISTALIVSAGIARGHEHPDHAHEVASQGFKNSNPHLGIVTSRPTEVDLPLPDEEDVYSFVVFGDRTGGPASGIKVLAKAVEDTNLLAPDLVMTVGDLVEGYNDTTAWMAQAKEYKSVMDKLDCPWFPVAGNHDVYPADSKKPETNNQDNYEKVFGPLWYAFEHKDSWFIVLYSDEGNPKTGKKAFNDQASQQMSPEQLKWLEQTLDKAKDAKHVFVFLHHPRWIGNNSWLKYGSSWDRVHEVLIKHGNVSAVFAGHIHYMRYDGVKDGIEYVTLATVGGGNSGIAPEAGFLHQFHVVTVRDDRIAMASLPVGGVQDVRKITAEVSGDARRLARSKVDFRGRPTLWFDADAKPLEVAFTYRNPTKRPVECTFLLDSKDSRWVAQPDHHHVRLKPGEAKRVTFELSRLGAPEIDEAYHGLDLVIRAAYLGDNLRVNIPERRLAVPLKIALPPASPNAPNTAADLDGDDSIAVNSEDLELPAGSPLTLECWFKARQFTGRTALVSKTQYSESGLFISGGKPSFLVRLGDRYVTAKASAAVSSDQWHHLAGVYDGQEVRLYLDGKLIDTQFGEGDRKTNGLPLIIGADPDQSGKSMSHFEGLIDEVRLSSAAIYKGKAFKPKERLIADDQTRMLINFDQAMGVFHGDRTSYGAHGHARGNPELTSVISN